MAYHKMNKKAFKSDAIDRVCFLSEASKLLAHSGEANLTNLSAYYGYTGRELCLKNQITTPGWSSVRRNRCERCLSSIQNGKTGSIKLNAGCLTLKCSLCGQSKKYPVRSKRHTHYERLLYDDEACSSSSQEKEKQAKRGEEVISKS